jgi:hypothetical protein
MTKLILTAIAACTFIAGPAVANPGDTKSDNASAQACFGQWRAFVASGLAQGTVLPGSGLHEGDFNSERKGDNAERNVSDKAECEAL